MARTVTVAVHRDDEVYAVRALEVEIASQGPTIEGALAALREALDLYFEKEDEGYTITLAHPRW